MNTGLDIPSPEYNRKETVPGSVLDTIPKLCPFEYIIFYCEWCKCDRYTRTFPPHFRHTQHLSITLSHSTSSLSINNIIILIIITNSKYSIDYRINHTQYYWSLLLILDQSCWSFSVLDHSYCCEFVHQLMLFACVIWSRLFHCMCDWSQLLIIFSVVSVLFVLGFFVLLSKRCWIEILLVHTSHYSLVLNTIING